MLEECPDERRGWEWNYLKRQCHTELRSLTGHVGNVYSVAYSPDGRLILSAGADRTVRIWDSSTGHLLQTWDGYRNTVCGLTISPDGQTSGLGQRVSQPTRPGLDSGSRERGCVSLSISTRGRESFPVWHSASTDAKW